MLLMCEVVKKEKLSDPFLFFYQMQDNVVVRCSTPKLKGSGFHPQYPHPICEPFLIRFPTHYFNVLYWNSL